MWTKVVTMAQWLWAKWVSHGTRILGVAIGIDAALAGVADIIPATQLKYHLAAIAVMTFLRGQFNAKQIQP